MRTSLKWLLYFVYAAVVTTFFLYSLFPDQAVHRYLTHHLNRADTDLNVKIGPIKPTFPPALVLNNVKLHYKNEPVFETLALEVRPKLKTLWKEVKTYSFNCDAYGGTAQGQFTLEGDFSEEKSDGNLPPMRLIAGEARLAEMQMDRLDVLRSMPADYKLKGALQGKIVFKNDPKVQNQTVKVRLKATGATVKILNPILKLGEITSDRIDINFSQNNQLITLTQFNLNGKQLNGKLSGQINLQKPLEKSVINLNGSVQPHRIFLADIKSKLPVNLLPPKIFNQNGFSFRIGGTFVKPKFSLR